MIAESKTENFVLRVDIDGNECYVSRFDPSGQMGALNFGKFSKTFIEVDPNTKFPCLVKTADKAWLYQLDTNMRPIAQQLCAVIHTYMPNSNVKVYIDHVVLKTVTQIVDYRDSDEVVIQYATK